MGVCGSCCAAPTEEAGHRVKTTGDSKSLADTVIFRVKAEVYSLSCDDESLRWIPVFSESVQISMECLQEGDVYIYTLHSSPNGKKQHFSTKIYIPGVYSRTKLRQTSECFIQWRDWNDDAGAWGINFTSESDAAKFLEACSPPSLTPNSARMRHAFSTLSLSLPIPSKLEQDEPSKVNKFVINTSLGDAVSQNEKYEEQVQDNSHNSAQYIIENHDGVTAHSNQAAAVESSLLPDVSILTLQNEESTSSFKRKSILFSEKYSQSGSFEDGPSLPSSPPPGPLMSPCMSVSSGTSSPRYSWLFSPSGTEGINVTNLSVDPPELPLSSPPGKPLSPRTSNNFVNTDSLHLIPGSRMPLSTLLTRLPLAEIVMHESDEPTDGTVNEGQTNNITDDANHKTESVTKTCSESQATSNKSPKLKTKDAEDSDVDTKDSERIVKDKEQLTDYSNELTGSLASDMHSTIESFMKSSTFTGSSGYHSDPVAQSLDCFQPSKKRESSSTAPTEISNTSDETHVVGKLNKSNSANSLNTFSTESEEDTVSRSTHVTNATNPPPRLRAFSDLTVSSTMENKHVVKAGFLEMKRILVHRNQIVAMASRKQWKKYWAKLKGSTLVFYICESVSSISEEAPVSLRIDIEGCIAHPEHMKRDNVICLSTSIGDTYYLQTTSQAEVDSWIRTIHSVAVISLSKHLIKEESISILKKRQTQIEEMIESEKKLIKLAELQLSISNPTSKEIITCEPLILDQLINSSKKWSVELPTILDSLFHKIEEWTKNIERLYVELYRHRCYLASLQGTELPNPQSLLANISKSTKSALVKLGTFTVASVHAKVCARHGGMLHSLQRKTSASSIFKLPLGTSMNLPNNIRKVLHGKKKTSTLPRGKKEISHPLLSGDHNSTTSPDHEHFGDKNDSKSSQEGHPVRVKMPNGENNLVINESTTVNDILLRSCEKMGLDSEDYFIQLWHETENGELATAIPSNEDLLIKWEYSHIEVIQKLVYTLKLIQSENEHYNDFGMIIAPKYSDKVISKLFVKKVVDDGPADIHGIIEGDEIVMINENHVAGMKLLTLQQQFKDKSIFLTIKSSTTEVPYSFKETTDTVINDLVLPAPPSQDEITEDSVNQLIIPDPESMETPKAAFTLEDRKCSDEIHLEEVDKLLKDSDDLNRLLHSMKEYSEDDLDDSSSRRHLSNAEKLCKCLLELLDTEQEYVKDLDKLVSRYLIPLKAESFITPTELTVLFGNILEITKLQQKFLEHLELILEDISTTSHHEHMQEDRVRRIMFSVAGTFICFIDHFRLYSTFCASHCQAQEVLRQTENDALQQFLAARNPKNDHTLTLEALLIKPIQRVLRYPLFLKAMKDLTPHHSDEQDHLIEAIKEMDKVADYINEMQRIHDSYSPLFIKLMSQSQDEKERLNLTIGELLYKCEVMWLNAPEELGKGWKKGFGPDVLCFVFISAILITLEKKKAKKQSKGTTLDVEEVKFSVAIPLSEYSIFDLPDSDGVTGMWQLVQVQKDHRDTKTARYLFRSLESQKKEILEIIKEKSCNSDVIQL